MMKPSIFKENGVGPTTTHDAASAKRGEEHGGRRNRKKNKYKN